MGGFDTIVVGAGSSGSVIARRLADVDQRVLVVEAGGDDANPAIAEPGRMGELWHSADDWDYSTVPQRHAAGRRLHLPRGKVLGGSHALNAMIWVRGAPADYDAWAAMGNQGWAWRDVLPIFADIENCNNIGNAGHTGSEDDGSSGPCDAAGPLDVINGYPLHPVQRSIIDAAREVGLSYNPDYNDGVPDGISQQQVTIRDGRRLTTYTAYLKPVLDAGRVTLATRCQVHRLLFSGQRVVGVEYARDGELIRVYADEVILAAGTLDSPRILSLSGIGPAEHLHRLGIAVVADLPGVGQNLHDHLLSPTIFATDTQPVPPTPAGMSVTQTHIFWRSRSDLTVPDTQPINFQVPMYEPWMHGPDNGFSLMAGMITPMSRGSLWLVSPDPATPVAIDLNALAEPADVHSLEASVRQCRDIGAAPALVQEWGARELYPGPELDDAALTEYVRRTAITYHHQVGTCVMGVSPLAVVSPRLRVHGVDGLRVADASVMPTITTGNTNAPTVLIGEQAVRFALAE